MSKRLKELRQRQHDLKMEATALLDAADADGGRDLTEDEEARFSAIESDLKKVSSEISAEEAKAERRRSLDAVRTAPPEQDRQPTRSPARSNMTNEPDPSLTNGFRNVADFANAVRTACTPETRHMLDSRLAGGVQAAPTNYHEGGGSSGEGFELPVQFRNDIWDLVFQLDDILSMVDLEPTQNRQVDWTADETTPWGSTGVVANWRAEGSQMTASKMGTKGRSLSLHELYAFVLATEELLEDAPRLNSRLTNRAAQAINWKINDALIYGTGAGQPLGWFNSSALVSVAKETSQAADTINAINLAKMYSRLLVVPGDMPIWMANSDILPQLVTMTIGDQPAWIPASAGMQGAPDGYLLGRPVRFSEHCKTLGDKGDIQLISPKGYYAVRRTAGAQFASSMHLYFDYNIQAFRWTFRFGGQPHLSAPVSPANGSNTKSHFVTLDERAGG